MLKLQTKVREDFTIMATSAFTFKTLLNGRLKTCFVDVTFETWHKEHNRQAA